MNLPAFVPRFVRCTLGGVVMALAASGARAQWSMYDAFKANPAAHLDVSGTKGMAVSKKVLVPTVYVRVATSGSVFAAKQKGSGTASAKATYTVEGHDRDALMALAKKIEEAYIAHPPRGLLCCAAGLLLINMTSDADWTEPVPPKDR